MQPLWLSNSQKSLQGTSHYAAVVTRLHLLHFPIGNSFMMLNVIEKQSIGDAVYNKDACMPTNWTLNFTEKPPLKFHKYATIEIWGFIRR